jgi:hypothetical protein
MTEITLKLTFEELKQIDKFVELNDETRPLFDKIRNAYPKPETLLDVIRNLGYSVDMCYEIVDAVEEFQKPKEPEDNEWKTVALGFGENLSAIGPDGYYDFTPVEWYDWVVDIYENTANEYLKLLEKERAKAKAQKHEKELVRESVKWCEEHPEKSVEDYLKPHTPKPMNEVLDRLENKYKDAEENAASYMTDEVVNRMLKKWETNPPSFLRFELGKTLEALITRWWCDVFGGINQDWDMETAIDDLCDQIELWLPKSQSHEGTQSVSVIDLVDGYNDALKKIKSKLRNKK